MKVPSAPTAHVLLSEQASESFRSCQGTINSPTEPVAAAVGPKVTEEVKEPVEVVEASEEPCEVADFLDINDLKVSELREILDSKGVVYGGAKKSGLIKLVKAAE